jgi:hypothetical protein
MAVAAEFGRNDLIGGLVGVGGAEDDATAKDESLGSGASADEGFELATQVGGQIENGAEGTRHDKPPDQQR